MAGAAIESRLAIVIDTKSAEDKIKRLRAALSTLTSSASTAGAGADRLSAGNNRVAGSAAAAAAANGRLSSSTAAAGRSHNAAAAAAVRSGAAATATATRFSTLRNASSQLTSSINSMSGAFTGLFAALSILSVFKTADAMQSLNSKIKLVTNSSEEYLAVQSRLRDMAQSNLTNYGSLVDLYSSSRRALAQLGKTQNETLMFTENITKAMFIGGGAAASQAAALVQLGQALSSGVLRGEEFNSIAEQAPILLELIADKLGVAQGALRGMAKDGLISAGVVYDSIEAATEKLTELAAKMPATMTQGLETVKNQYRYFIDDMLNSTGGFSSVVASALIGIGQNLNSLIPIIVAAGLAWGAYALATSTAVTTSVAASVTGMTSMGYAFLSNTALIKAQILSYFELNAMIARYSTNMMIARLTMAHYKDIVITTALSIQAKVKAIQSSIAAHAADAAVILRNGEAAFRLGLVTIGATLAIVNKVKAMSSGITVGSAYAATLNIIAGSAAVATTVVTTLTGAIARLGAVINKHPLMILAGVLLSVVAATEDAEGKTLGLSGAMSSLSDAISVVGYIFIDVVKYFIDGVSAMASTFGSFITEFVQGSEYGANESSNMFGVFFENTENGFVGILQVISRVLAAAVGTLGGFFSWLGKGVALATKGLANAFIWAFNKVLEVGADAINGVVDLIRKGFGAINKIVSGANSILALTPLKIRMPTIDIGEGAVVTAKQIDMLSTSYTGLGESIGSYTSIAMDAVNNTFSSATQRLKEAKAERNANLDIASSYDAIGDAADKAGKKKKAAKEKQPKTAKDKAAEEYAKLLESYAQQMAAFKREAYDLSTPFTTELSKIAYEVDNADGKFFGLAETLKNDLRNAAANLDAFKMGDIYRTTVLGMERELSLLDNDSMFSQWAYDLMDANNILSTMDDTLKEGILESVAKLEKAKAESTINNSIEESIEGINREIGLMGTSGSALDEFIWDLNNTEKYANASGDAISNLGDALTKLENLKGRESLKGVLNRIEGTTPQDEIDAQYQSDLEALNSANLIELGMLETHKEAKLAIDKSYQDAKRDLELQRQANMVGSLTAMFGMALGETSKGYQAMFAVQKAYDFVQAQSASFTAIAKAWSSAPFPANLPAVATTTLSTGIIPAAISALSPKGFKTGGYTGNMGVNQVAGAVHGQEYVFDAAATKRIGVDNLNAMRSGKAANDDSKVSINIVNNSSAQVTASDDGQTITITDVRNEVKRGFTNLQNPNSYESKQINRNVQAPRRR